MGRKLFLLQAAAAVLFFSSTAYALPGYMVQFRAQYPNAFFLGCVACHTTANPVAPAPRNFYGLAFQQKPHATPAAQRAALVAIEPLDSDGDGFTNLTEIAASSGNIRRVLPGFKALPLTLPAAAGWKATPPVPPGLLFVENFSNAIGPTVPNWTKFQGPWSGVNGVLKSTSLIQKASIILASPPHTTALSTFSTGSIRARISLPPTAVNNSSAFIIWSFSVDPLGVPAFRWVRFNPAQIVFGQDGIVAGAAVGVLPGIPFAFGPGTPHDVRVTLSANGLATIFVDNSLVGSHQFNTAAPGKTGFMTQRATAATFDNPLFALR